MGGRAVIGHYHSHPSGDPTPSLRDAADALPDGSLWLIVGDGVVRAFRAVANGVLHDRFDPVALRVVASPVTRSGQSGESTA